jgi:Phage integrase, N-terminal SAM-like domain
MSIRKRTWKTEGGEERSAWLVEYSTAEREQRGKRTRHIRTFDRKKDAEDFQARVRVDLKKGTHTPNSQSITVEAAGSLWLDGCADLESTSRDQYGQHLKFHIVPYLGPLKLSTLTAAIVRDWQDKLRNGVPSQPEKGRPVGRPQILLPVGPLDALLFRLRRSDITRPPGPLPFLSSPDAWLPVFLDGGVIRSFPPLAIVVSDDAAQLRRAIGLTGHHTGRYPIGG